MVPNTQKCLDATRQYYAKWFGAEPALFDSPGVVAIESEQRDVALTGYPKPSHLYCLVIDENVAISYSPRLVDRIDKVIHAFQSESDTDSMCNRLRSDFPHIGYGLKFVYTTMPTNLDTSDAIRLDLEDYSAFAQFYREMHNTEEIDWLREYFVSMAGVGNCRGVFDGGKLVCATDAPSVPYMADEIVEIGINTLPEYRRRGYARMASAAMVRHLLASGKVPIWSCGRTNTGSMLLAESIGFRKFADAVAVTLED
jgi:GNAT superfamily N-acetyltransferase